MLRKLLLKWLTPTEIKGTVQIHKVYAAYLNGPLPLEPDVNKWLYENSISWDDLIRITFHVDQVATCYPAPNNFRVIEYALIYYKLKPPEHGTTDKR